MQFRGTSDEGGDLAADSDPLLAEYEARGYPVRTLQSFPGHGGGRLPDAAADPAPRHGRCLVTAPEADPEAQYRWLRLLERHWIGAEQGNQVSYTLKLYTDRHDIAAFREIVLEHQPDIRCCALLPSRPDQALGYEYLPEERSDRAIRRAGRGIPTRRCTRRSTGASALRRRRVPDLMRRVLPRRIVAG